MTEGEFVPGAQPDAAPPPGGSPVVDWITLSTRGGRTVLAAIPAGYAAYATIDVPDSGADRTAADAALVEVLQARTGEQPWWLGFLDTGVADIVDPTGPHVSVYVGWPYALVQGGPQQALTSRADADSTPWHGALPELLFPADRSWLVSTMWDDDWRCVGGPVDLVEALLARPELAARRVAPDDDLQPPRA